MSAVFVAALFSLLPQQPVAAPPKPLLVRGMVLDGELRPAPEVAIAVIADENVDAGAALATPAVRTAADGTFAVTVDESMHALLLGGGKFATMQALISRLQNRSGEVDLGPIALAPGTIGGGRVRDEKGEPIAGALVDVIDLLDVQPFVANRDGIWRCRTSGSTDARGIFRLTGMVQSAGRLRVQKEGYFDEVRQPLAVGEPLDFTLVAAGVVHGRVIEADGTPVANAKVMIGSEPEVATTMTDHDGRFTAAPRRRGGGAVRVVHPRTSAIWNGSFDARPVLVRLPALANVGEDVVRVAARGADGAPLTNFTAWVSWHRADQDRERLDLLMFAATPHPERWSAESVDGVATVRGPRSRYRDAVVVVRADGHAPGRMRIERTDSLAEPVSVTLEPDAVIRGRVTDTKSGTPIAGATVFAVPELDESERQRFTLGGMRAIDLLRSPGVLTDTEGRYEIRGVAAGVQDVIAHVPGRVDPPLRSVVAVGGGIQEAVDFAVPGNVVLTGRIEGPLPSGGMVRVCWHRPYVDDRVDVNQYQGARHVPADGAFVFPDLEAKAWEVQLVCAVPARGGRRLKLPMGVFDGAAPPVAPVLFSAPVPVQVRGSVGGLVPWHRLAVAVFWLEFRPGKSADFRIDGPLTLVQPDRSYSLVAPPQRHHVLLFDVLTGVALEWHEVVPTAARSLVVDFRGLAVPVDVTLEVTANRALGNPMRVMYEPTVDHWPGGIGMLAETRAGRGLRQGMRFDARAGEKHTFWLRERSGKLGIDSYPAIDLADTVGPIVLSTSH